MSDTIFALATPAGRSGVAVIRVSGTKAWEGAKALGLKNFHARQAAISELINPATGELIDKALVLPFLAPNSFTGEDVVEYHVHGSRVIVDSMYAALQDLPGHRLAERGEFTRRAFENGKLDLTEAEAIADLINAQTQAQKDLALKQLGGALSLLYQNWTSSLTKLLAHIEADLEFPDEDLPEGIMPQIMPQIVALKGEIEAHLNDNRRGERLREGFQLVIIGQPNVGKSSLINALVQRDVAIVSDLAGTTRDILEAHLDIGGFPVTIADTAGLRPQDFDDGHARIESEGMRRALKKAHDADLKLLVFDAGASEPDPETKALADDKTIIVVNKCDEQERSTQDPLLMKAMKVSAKTGQGLGDLLTHIEDYFKNYAAPGEAPSLTRSRHRKALEEARESLKQAEQAALPEIVAEDIRLAVRSIGRITGKVDVEDVLDVVFKDFCIGK